MQSLIKNILLSLLFIGGYAALNVVPVRGAGDVVAQETKQNQEVINIEVNGTISKQLTHENIMYLVGNFTQVKLSGSTSISRNNIALIDLQTQSLLPWNPSFNGTIHDIEVYKDYIFLAGEFTKIDGVERPYFVVVDKNPYTILDPMIEVNAPVFAVERYNNTLFVGGSFTSFAGADRTYIASFNLDTSQINNWSPFLNGPVRAVVINDDILYVAGEFTLVGDTPRQHVTAFNLPSGVLSTWSPNSTYPVRSLDYRDNALVIVSQNPTTEQSSETIIPLEAVTQTPISSVDAVSFPISPTGEPVVQGLMVDTSKLGFAIPTLSDLLTFSVRIFFVIAGLAALFYMLIGAFAWVTSGGDKDAVGAARDKIQAAVVGLIMMVVVLAIVWTLEQVVFKRRICLGVSCPLTLPSLLEPIN